VSLGGAPKLVGSVQRAVMSVHMRKAALVVSARVEESGRLGRDPDQTRPVISA
jgi:hypothetical protein